jgi:chromosome segregation ATPase
LFELEKRKDEEKQKYLSDIDELKLHEESKKNEIERKKAEIDREYETLLQNSLKQIKDKAMQKDFEKSTVKDFSKEYEKKIENLEKDLKTKNDKLSSVRSELYSTTEQLEHLKID